MTISILNVFVYLAVATMLVFISRTTSTDAGQMNHLSV